MDLIDTRATELPPTSLFLTRFEFKEIYPYRLNSRLNYLFKYDKPTDVPDAEAKLLLKKYPHLLKWKKQLNIVETNRHQELMKVKYGDLKKMGGKLGMSFKELQGVKLLLIDRIVAKEIEIKQLAAKAKANKKDGVT